MSLRIRRTLPLEQWRSTKPTHLTSISVSLLESRIVITAVRIDTVRPHLYRQPEDCCDDERENLIANSLTPQCFQTVQLLRSRSHADSPALCSPTMFAVYLFCVSVAHFVCDLGWSDCSSHPRPLHLCGYSGVPWVSLPPTSVPSSAQAGWH